MATADFLISQCLHVFLAMFQVRSLVISPQDDQRTWLKYASLCRNAGRLQLSHKTLVTILGKDPLDNLEVPLPTQHPQATFAFTKHLWDTGMKEKGLQHLQSFVHNSLHPKCAHVSQEASHNDGLKEQESELRQLLARCYLRLGQWQENMQGVNDRSIPAILQCYAAATEYDSAW